jgi:glucosamine-6-phosphate deaminase
MGTKNQSMISFACCFVMFAEWRLFSCPGDAMSWEIPPYLCIPAAELGRGQPVKVHVAGDAGLLAQQMAADMLGEMRAAAEHGRGAVLIVPVGPVDQFPILADMINRERFACRNVTLINMDEYLTDDDRWIPLDHPLSFRAFMQRLFYDRLDPELSPRDQNRVFPDPERPQQIQQIIADRGGVDACFGGIGINGHIAFNEPPADDQPIGVSEFAELPTRVLTLTRETRTINSVTVGGEISIIPRRAVTVGMNECLAARRMRFYCNRPWQSAVVRRVLHGPITPQCPASLLRLHGDASITMTDYVAQPPQIQLR